MRYTKADVIFVTGFLSPILLVACMFGVASMSWATQQSQVDDRVQQLIRETTDEVSPTLESMFGSNEVSADAQRVLASNRAEWDELLLAFNFVLQRMGSETILEDNEFIHQVVPPSHADRFPTELSRNLQRAAPLLKELDTLLSSRDPSLAQAMKDRVQCDGVGRGNLESFPIFPVYTFCELDFLQSIVDDDPERALRSIERLLNLLARQPCSLYSISFTNSTLTRVRESLVFNFWKPSQLQRVRDLIAEPLDFSRVLHKHELTKLLLVKSALPDARKIHQLKWLTDHVSLAHASNATVQQTVSPSQALRILDLISPETDASNPAGYDRSFGIDRWISRSGMQAIEFNGHWIPHPNYYRSSAERVEKDRVFTLAAVGLRMIYLRTGSYPGSLDQLTTVGWSEVEIAEATTLLEWEKAPAAGGSTLTAIHAHWMKDAEGQVLDGGFSKQVRFTDGS